MTVQMARALFFMSSLLSCCSQFVSCISQFVSCILYLIVSIWYGISQFIAHIYQIAFSLYVSPSLARSQQLIAKSILWTVQSPSLVGFFINSSSEFNSVVVKTLNLVLWSYRDGVRLNFKKKSFYCKQRLTQLISTDFS